MRVHILGICGTFMGGIAHLAKTLGHEVAGSDANVYPPMSTQLAALGVDLMEGYDPKHLRPAPDCVVIGNALSRGNPAVEHVLDEGIPYLSGPEFLARYVLNDKWVLAVSGTHGKTTTSSMLAWILEYAGLKPGFLIGGVPENFGVSARLGETPFFVVEADEYDTAFFDKRSKFVHYHPRTLIVNNIEFDHADIFPDLAAIQRQFHHLVRTVPGKGLILAPSYDAAVADTFKLGCWTPIEPISPIGMLDRAGWGAELIREDGSEFDVYFGNAKLGRAAWPLVGLHNVHNALAAIGAARHAGVPAASAIAALTEFHNVKRRLEVRGVVKGITVYDDFAHHPTAIATTVHGLRKRVGDARIIAVLEARSNTMRMGVHKESLAPSLSEADQVILFQPSDLPWSLDIVAHAIGPQASVLSDVGRIVEDLALRCRSGDHILIMSNGGFGGIHGRLLERLARS